MPDNNLTIKEGWDIISVSPDREHVAVLRYSGEIPFGPRYFSLEIDDRRFRRTVFGRDHLWSTDSRFLALQEWLSTRKRGGPKTRLMLIDVSTMRKHVLGALFKGFVVPKSFEENKLVFEEVKHFDKDNVLRREAEVGLPKLGRYLDL